MTYREMQNKSIETIDKRIEELLANKNAIIRRLSYALPEWMRNMTTGVRMMELRYIADRDGDCEMKKDLMAIDNLRQTIKELVDIRKQISSLC